MSKVVKKLIQYSANNLNLKKINAGYYEINKGSAKIFKKCGFKIEGVKKKDVIFEDKRIDSILVGFVV